MFIHIEIPDKVIPELSRLTGVPNDQNFESNVTKHYADSIYNSLRKSVEGEKEIEIKQLLDAVISEGEIKPVAK